VSELEATLNRQGDAIDRVLAGYGVAARVRGADVLPRLIAHKLVLRLGVKISAVEAVARELALALGVESVRVAPRNGTLAIEVPRADGKNVYLVPMLERLAKVPACSPLLGLDETGLPLVLSLPSPDVAHALIAGTTGAGKTVLARTMVLSLAARNEQRRLQVGLLDPKGRAYDPLRSLPHVLFYEADPERALGWMRWLLAEMLRRDQDRRHEPRIVLFIDELADLVMAAGTGLQEALTRLTQRGREAGIHIVACTQKPTAEVMGALAKANFPTRIVGKVPDAGVAATCAGVPGSGAEVLQGRGDFVVVSCAGVMRLQAAYAPGSEVARLVDKCVARNGQGNHLLLDAMYLREQEAQVGRPEDPITLDMLAEVVAYEAVHGKPPSGRWIRKRFQCGNDRAQRAIEMARAHWNEIETHALEAGES